MHATLPAKNGPRNKAHLARSCPLSRDGSTAGLGDCSVKAAKAIENMGVAQDAAGTELLNVTSMRVLVASSDHVNLVTSWDVARDAFGDHGVPSNLMGVTVLGYGDQLVEIEAVEAVIG